jgi:hypothetical protein
MFRGVEPAYSPFNEEIVNEDLRCHVAYEAEYDTRFTDLSRAIDAESMDENARSKYKQGRINVYDQNDCVLSIVFSNKTREYSALTPLSQW